jgi:hypothetical protein
LSLVSHISQNSAQFPAIDHNLFSVYTKRGSVVEFVIWPALILNKNGPILSKGVVQGKENKTQETAEMKHDVKTFESGVKRNTLTLSLHQNMQISMFFIYKAIVHHFIVHNDYH